MHIHRFTRIGSRSAAAVAAAGLLFLAAFQVLLALGLPLGRAAYGGGQEVLPTDLRVASVVAACVWSGAALLVLRRAGYGGAARPSRLLRLLTWLLVGLLCLGAIVNFASSSPWERFGWGPFVVVVGLLCFVVARDAGRSLER